MTFDWLKDVPNLSDLSDLGWNRSFSWDQTQTPFIENEY